jgi:DNA-binding response OmpR family regulator
MRAARVLLIDDDPAAVQSLQPVLHGIGCQLRCAAPDRGVLADIVHDPPDLVVLGINDGSTGWSLCGDLLALLDAPLFLLLTSRREADRIRGLQMGAVACVSKGTCSAVELAARLRATLRRAYPAQAGGEQGVGTQGLAKSGLGTGH